jgi:UDP-N-acetylglucosamine 2-epimerase
MDTTQCIVTQVPVAHVEAGLRTYSLYNPFPEEANRRLIGAIASYNFAATRRSQDALLGVCCICMGLEVTPSFVFLFPKGAD